MRNPSSSQVEKKVTLPLESDPGMLDPAAVGHGVPHTGKPIGPALSKVEEAMDMLGLSVSPERQITDEQEGFDLSAAHYELIALLPADLQAPACEVVREHQLSLNHTRWLVALLSSGPGMALPVAVAMVQGVTRTPVGELLARIEEALDELPAPAELTGSERKMILVILDVLMQRAQMLKRALLAM